jgi:hypothetical protein
MPNVVKACIKKIEKAIAQQLNLHWVKFQLKDDKGKPLANIVVKVKLPDDSIEEATSDKTGLIYIKNLKPGNCTIDLAFDGQTADTSVFLQ